MTSQEPQTTPDTADNAAAETEVIAVPEPAPVFVDATGRRSRLLRRVALAFGVLLVAYGGLVSISLAGGPVSSSAVLPLPGFGDDDENEDEATPQPRPTPAPTPTPSVSPARRTESAVRDGGEQRRPIASTSAKTSTKATRSAKPTPTPSASSGSPTPRPLESTTATQQPTVEPNATTTGPAVPATPPNKPQP